MAFIETEYREPDRYVRPGTKLPLFRLKIVDVLTGRTRTLAESDDEWAYLLRVAWSGDSHRMVYYRMNRAQNRAELQMLDPRESSADCPRTILTEKDSYWVNAPETPLFTRDGSRLVISSERSGDRHIYLYALEGGMIRDLTPPDLNVSRLHRAADAEGNVYVSGSTGDRQQQHLYRLPFLGGDARQMTTSVGWHDVSLGASANVFLDTYSSASTPPVVVWHGQLGTVPQGSPTRQRPTANEFFQIETHDQVRLATRLFTPDDFDASQKYPVILYTFAGPQGRVVQDAWSGWQMAWNRHMVSQGYLVLAVDVRGSGDTGTGLKSQFITSLARRKLPTCGKWSVSCGGKAMWIPRGWAFGGPTMARMPRCKPCWLFRVDLRRALRISRLQIGVNTMPTLTSDISACRRVELLNTIRRRRSRIAGV